MQIFIKTQRGKTIVLEAEGEESIKSIKEKIKEREGIPEDFQYLIFGRKTLQNEKTLKDYGINDQSTIQQNLKIGYGATPQTIDIVEGELKNGNGTL